MKYATDTTAARCVLSRSLLALLLVLGASVDSPRADDTDAPPGAVVLVGEVLRYNHPQIWQRICELADRRLSDMVVIAAAAERPKLYASFAERALARYGVFAEVARVAVDAAEFGVPYREAVGDPELLDRVQAANGVFFVGGAPQRLARVLFDDGGTPTPLAAAIVRVHADGGLVVGGIPGPAGVRTGFDVMDALERGHIAERDLYRGMGMTPEGWAFDQHFFSAGRFAEVLVAMRQLGLAYGLGVGVDTAAIIEGARVEIVGGEGAILLDLSGANANGPAGDGFRLAGIRLSYLDDGDALDLGTRKVVPSPGKLAGLELAPKEEPILDSNERAAVAEDVFARGRLVQLMRRALDGGSNEATGIALREQAGARLRGFRFHFRTGDESVGWLSVGSGSGSGLERFTILNVYLDIEPMTRDEAQAESSRTNGARARARSGRTPRLASAGEFR